MGADAPAVERVLGVPAPSRVPHAGLGLGPQPGGEGAEHGCSSTGKSSELIPQEGRPPVPRLCGVSGEGHRSSAPQRPPGTPWVTRPPLSWGCPAAPGGGPGFWGSPRHWGGGNTPTTHRTFPCPESRGGCAVPWHLRPGEPRQLPEGCVGPGWHGTRGTRGRRRSWGERTLLPHARSQQGRARTVQVPPASRSSSFPSRHVPGDYP